MRRYIICLFLPLVLSSLSGCAHIEEEHFEEQEFVTLTFKATMEDSQTKNTLGGSADDPFRSLYWLPSDEIAVYAWNSSYNKFTNINTENSSVADFMGEGMDRDRNYAVYPYSAVVDWGWGSYEPRINVPVKQIYAENTFATDMFPMVARAGRGETLQFKNLCGVLVVNLKGEEIVKNIALAAYDQAGSLTKIAGTYNVNLEYEDVPVLTNGADALQGTMIEMDCGEGVQLNPAEPTNFHFVLAPGEYSRIAVVVTTVDGKVMVKEGRNPLTIRRSEWISSGALQYVESVSIDLSEIGHSNCYIVPKSGLYSFDADVIGNGDFGLVPGTTFSSTNTTISPVSAEVIWEDRTGILSSVTLKDNKISFIATGQEGNALIAAKNANGEILWSWHIWITDQPQEHVYVNDRGTFTMLDRNIGATRADRGSGEEWRESQGMRYQWGRKDPFGRTADSYKSNLYNRISSQLTIAESIQYPKSIIQNNNPWASDMDSNLWSKNQKTIYDPCPVGYRVPPMDVWRGFTVDGGNADRRSEMNVSGSFDHGWNFIYDGSNTAWYPTSYYISLWGDYFQESEYEGHYWSVDSDDIYSKNYFRFYYDRYSENPDFNCSINFDYYHDMSNALAVRCMKDEGHVDISYPTVKITSVKDLSAAGASIVANVSDEGVSAVTERGIVWGTSKDISLDNAEKVIAESAGAGEYIITLDGLAHSTTYYVRAYAINERGISYSDVRSFYTPYDGDAVNLSRGGTANCYIVPPVYSDYVFNASVKGNSDESVGDIASVEVLWETCNTSTAIEVRDVIESVSLEGNNVLFRLPFEPKPGNALIAVKDALGTILWSWHIWVVDFDPVATQQKYDSGAVMMDRNLGALNMIPGDLGSFGLMYQWGRKDPFVGSGVYYNDGWMPAFTAPSDAIRYEYYNSSTDTIENAVKNPTVVYNDARWGDASDLWGYKKTKYDPCPVGWRMSDLAAWENLSGSWEYRQEYLTANISSSVVYFPTTGYKTGDEYTHNVQHGAYFWLTERGWYVDMYWDRTPELLGGREVDYLYSVRCMKDVGTDKPGSGDDVIVDDEYEW